MVLRAILSCALGLAGCGGSAIVTASRHIAELRGCEPAELTLEATGASFAASGCGAPGAYRCTDAACEASGGGGEMDTQRVVRVRGQLEALDAELAACARGAEAPVVQVHVDRDGRPQGLALHPPLDAEVRGCVGALILDHVDAGPGAELLVAPDVVPAPPNTPSTIGPPPDEPAAPPDEDATGEDATGDGTIDEGTAPGDETLP